MFNNINNQIKEKHICIISILTKKKLTLKGVKLKIFNEINNENK